VNKESNIENALRKWLENADKIVVVGIGNELRRDDFVGVEVVRSLKDRVSKRVMLVESETVPESFIEPITRFNPTHIMIIDAGLLGLKPASVKFLESSKALGPFTGAISTHTLPLRIFCEYLEKTINANIALIIVQPKRTDFGERLSREVGEVAERLEKMLLEILPHTLKKKST
jgi:hydrogenase 3 maturation protease